MQWKNVVLHKISDNVRHHVHMQVSRQASYQLLPVCRAFISEWSVHMHVCVCVCMCVRVCACMCVCASCFCVCVPQCEYASECSGSMPSCARADNLKGQHTTHEDTKKNRIKAQHCFHPHYQSLFLTHAFSLSLSQH